MSVIVILLLLVGLIAVAISAKHLTSSATYKRKPLMSAPEIRLYGRLIDALPDHFVFPQIALPALVEVQARRQEWQSHWNRIRSKYVDFVVCRKDFSVVAIIELDDRTHSRPNRIKADRQKDTAVREAGYRMVRWTVRDMPDRFEIARQLLPSP